jgi:hypothetical protein
VKCGRVLNAESWVQRQTAVSQKMELWLQIKDGGYLTAEDYQTLRLVPENLYVRKQIYR